MSKFKKVFSAALVAIVVTSLSAPSAATPDNGRIEGILVDEITSGDKEENTKDDPVDGATTLQDLDERFFEASQTRKEKEEELDGIVALEDTLVASIREIEEETEELEEFIEEIQEDIRVATSRIRVERRKITRLAARIAELEEIVKSRLVAAYMDSGTINYTSPLLGGSEGYSEFVRMEMTVKYANIADQEVAERLSANKKDMELAEEKLQEELDGLRDKKIEQEEKRTELEEKLLEAEEMQIMLDQLAKDVINEIRELEGEEDELLKIIGFYEERLGGQGRISAPLRVERPSSAKGLIWPLDGTLTSRFGMRWGAMHQGIDIGAPTGTPIYAANDGRVIFAGVQGGYGNIVIIDHGENFHTAYAHNSRNVVAAGREVRRGELIALVGSTGNSTGPHLHFETRVRGVAQDPLALLP